MAYLPGSQKKFVLKKKRKNKQNKQSKQKKPRNWGSVCFCQVKNSCLIAHSSFTQQFGTQSYWAEINGQETDWFFVHKQPNRIIIIKKKIYTFCWPTQKKFLALKWSFFGNQLERSSVGGIRWGDQSTWSSLSGCFHDTQMITWMEGIIGYSKLFCYMFYPKTGMTSPLF